MSPAARHPRRHWRRVLRAGQSDQGAAPFCARSVHHRQSLDFGRPVLPGDRLQLGRVSGERFYDIVYVPLLLLGAKLVFDGGRRLLA
jgi:hypothetical protein